MAWVDFYMQTTGNDLNAGSTNGDNAVYTSTGGNFDGTSVFTPTDGSTPASSINVGDYVSLYNTGDPAARCVAKVVTVAAGVNGAVTIDTTIKYGTVPVVNSGSRNLKAGGAWASFAIVAASAAFNTGTVPQSTRINVKAGTYTNATTSRALAMAGTTTLPLWWRGYKTTIGDQETNNLAVAGTDIPSITATTGLQSAAGAHQIFSSLAFSATTKSGFSATSSPCTFYGCQFTSSWANASGQAFSQNANNTVLVGCYLSSTSSANIMTTGGTLSAIGNTFKGGLVGLPIAAANNNFIMFNVFDSQAGDAINSSTGGGCILNNSIYAPSGNGINITGTPGAMWLIGNNYFESVNPAKAAINNTAGTNTNLIRCIGNAYFNCTTNTSGITENFTIFDNGTLPGLVGAFIAPLSQNFAISSLARGLGFPGLFENISAYQGYLDVGAVQRFENVGGGVSIGF